MTSPEEAPLDDPHNLEAHAGEVHNPQAPEDSKAALAAAQQEYQGQEQQTEQPLGEQLPNMSHEQTPDQGTYAQQMGYGHQDAGSQLQPLPPQHLQEPPQHDHAGQALHQEMHSEHPPTDAHQMQHQVVAHPHMQHEQHMQVNPAGMPLPHPVSFAQQMLDPQMTQQQLAQYHQQMAYQQHLAAAQYHQSHLQEVPPLYLAQPGMTHPQLQQVYQDAATHVHDPSKAPDMSSIDEAAVHLTALRNTGRPDGQTMDGQAGVPPMGTPHLGAQHMQTGMPDGSQPGQPRDPNYPAQDQQALMAGTGRPPSKRKAWRASHEGEGAEGMEGDRDSGRARRKQTRRPDRLCHYEGCFVTPTYNFPNEKKRIFCVTHKLDGMVNVVAKRCAHPECKVNPRFNYEGNPRGLYCSEHKLEGMVNVIDRRCQEPDCKKFPSHNYPSSHKKLYCATHKKEGMVDMSHGSN